MIESFRQWRLPFPRRLAFVIAILAALGWQLVPQPVSAAAIAPGNLVVVRIGDGSAAPTSAAAPVFLDEYTPAGALVQSIALPTAVSGNNRILTNSGSATSEGALNRSADCRYLTLAGYDAVPGTPAVANNTTSSAFNRIVGRVDANGTVDTSTRIPDGYSGNNIRGAVSDDGSRFWTGGPTGTTGGVRFVPYGNNSTTVQVTSAPTNVRVPNIFGGQLYVSSGSSPFIGVSQVGSGLPTTSGQTTTLLTGATAGNPYAYLFLDRDAGVPGLDTLYVADQAGGLFKFSLVGSTWTERGSISGVLTGLTGVVNGNSVVLYATSGTATGNAIVTLTDNAAFNATISGAFAPLTTAAADTVFRGLAFAPANVTTAAPTIESQPANTTIASGAMATLSVSACGSGPLTYQWYQGASGDTSIPVSNATAATFTTPALTTTTNYWVRVSNGAGSTDSATATVTVSAGTAPTIQTQPANQSIATGTSATLNVGASGTAPLHYQWYQGNSGDTSTPVGTDAASFTTPALTATTNYWVRVSNSAGSIDSTTATVTVTATSTTRIHDIQGTRHVSPLVTTINDNSNSFGAAVANVPGIVTALTSNGFYMQDPNPDSDPATSEGIFVFNGSGSKPAVGDSVQVSGAVAEFRSGCTSASCTSSSSAWNNLTTTELSANSGAGVSLVWNLVSASNPLPAATIIGQGGRVPPTTVIDDDTTGSVETPSTTFDPVNDGIDFYESLEGMLVQVNNAVASGPTSNFGSNREISVLSDNGANAGPRTARGGILIGDNYSDFNPERIILNDLIAGGPDLPLTDKVGDSFPGATTGVIDYSFANYKLQVINLPGVHDGGLPKEVTNLLGGTGKLTVADFNIENFTQANNPRIAPTASFIVNNLGAPDLLAIQEVQDNNGATDNGVVAADQTIQVLLNAIVSAGGPTYQYVEIDPVNDQDGGEPGGNIRQVILYRTDRGLSFVSRPGAGSTTANSVQNVGGHPQLQYSPGRIAPADTAWNSSRKPLAVEFSYNGQPLFVVNNHFNSKGGDQPLYGRFQPPTRGSEVQRLNQAHLVHDFVKGILDIDATAAVVVIGDLNDFQFSQVITTLKQDVLVDMMDTLPANERYSYDFEGNAQSLDHILVSNRLANGAEYDVIHVNSEFSDQTSDHDPSVARLALFAPVQAVADAYTVEAGAALTVGTAQAILANDQNGPLAIIAHTDPINGTLALNNDGSFVYTPNAGFTGPDSFNYTVSSAVQLYTTHLPPLATIGGVPITAGAYGSALYPVPGSSDEYYGLTDRGPNVDGPGGIKVEPLPTFDPAIGKFKLHDGVADLEQIIPLEAADGTPYSGRVSTEATTGETIEDLNGNVLPPDPNGYDSEGLVALPDGTFWVSDEYGPYITHFDAGGKQMGPRLSPFDGSLPSELKARVVNRGMEGLTITPDGSTLVGIMQSALQQSDLNGFDAKKLTPLRIVTYRLDTHVTHEYLYLLDNPNSTKTAVSEITALSDKVFLIDERDGNYLPNAYKKLYRIDIAGATDVGPASTVAGATYNGASGGLLIGGKSIEFLVQGQDTAASTTTLAANGITPAAKSLYLDVGALLLSLDSQGHFFAHDKLEGVATLAGGTKLVISNDSDFGIDGLTNSTPPFQLHAKTLPTGAQDEGEFLLIDLSRLPASLASATVSFDVKDTIPPTISAAATTSPNANGWYNTDVTVHFTCTDSGSGIPANACPADQVLNTEGSAVASTAQTVQDAAGNTSAPSNVVTVKIDKTKPDITLNSPAQGAIYQVNQVVAANYSCSDTLSQIASCVGTVASGANIPTNVPGTQSFVVNASDQAGNTNSLSRNYQVQGLTHRDHIQSVRDKLAALRATLSNKDDRAALDEAIKHLDKALASNLWRDGSHPSAKKGETVFDEVQEAVKELSKLQKQKKSSVPPATLQNFVDELVAATREIASVNLADAIAAHGDAKQIAQAQDELAKGDSDRGAGKPDDAIKRYEKAWKDAVEALPQARQAALEPGADGSHPGLFLPLINQ